MRMHRSIPKNAIVKCMTCSGQYVPVRYVLSMHKLWIFRRQGPRSLCDVSCPYESGSLRSPRSTSHHLGRHLLLPRASIPGFCFCKPAVYGAAVERKYLYRPVPPMQTCQISRSQCSGTRTRTGLSLPYRNRLSGTRSERGRDANVSRSTVP